MGGLFSVLVNREGPMVGGFNHNFRYKGRVFHVQTEDGGSRHPHIVTLLYEGGTILASSRTSYADLLGADDLRPLVEERMKYQHQDMLKRLRSGEFDARAGCAEGSVALSDALPRSCGGVSGVSIQDQPKEAATNPAASPGSLDELVFAYLAGNDPRYTKS
jgi:hypothetical protein